MTKGFHLLIFLSLSFIFSGCPQKDKTLPNLGKDNSIDPNKGREFDGQLKKGNIAGAIDSMVGPPNCDNCLNDENREQPKRKTISTRKIHMVAEIGNTECLKRGKSQDISKLGLNLQGANRSERRVMEDIAGTMIGLAGENQAKKLLGNAKVVYQNKLRTRKNGNCLPAHQLIAGEVHVARKCDDGSEVIARDGILVHELGHYAANRANLYPLYDKTVKRKCKISGYCTHNSMNKAFNHRKEEFAEVFGAFLLATDRLKRDCKDAYEFMKKHVFNNSNHMCESLP
jgi:hypothetical protein